MRAVFGPLVLSAALTAAFTPPAGAAAKARPVGPEYKFTPVNYGQAVVHAFEVKNEGDAPLQIRGIESDCSCMTATFDTTIAPGTAGTVKVTLDTSTLDGHQRHLLRVVSDDPEFPRVSLAMQGFVRGPIVVLPKGSFALRQLRGEPTRQTIEIENNQSRPLAITRVSASTAGTKAVLETLEKGSRYAIHVETEAALPAGNHRGSVIVQTDYPRRPKIDIPYDVLVLNAIQARPGVIYVGGPEGSDRKALKTITLRHLRGRPFRLTDVSSDQSNITSTQEEAKKGEEWNVNFTIPLQGYTKGIHERKVKILTNSPDAPLIVVPVSIRIR